MRSADHDVAISAAEAGAEVIRAKYETVLVRHAKSTNDFATNADIEAEQAITRVITSARPNDGVVGEELGERGPRAGRRWLVDPLCGTLNFSAHTPLVAVNVSLRGAGVSVAAAVVDPFSGEAFWTDGSVAKVRRGGVDQSLVPTADSRLVDLNVDGPFDEVHRMVTVRLLASSSFRQVFQPRVLSTTLALAWVAAGRRAGYVSEGNVRESVHFAAGVALCEAAGCVVSGIEGQPISEEPWGLVAAADHQSHSALIEMTRDLTR